MTYPAPTISNFMDYAIYLNTITESLFWIVVAFLTFFVAFTSLQRWGTYKALAASCFVNFILTVLLWAAGLVAEWPMYLFAIGAAFAGIMLYRE